MKDRMGKLGAVGERHAGLTADIRQRNQVNAHAMDGRGVTSGCSSRIQYLRRKVSLLLTSQADIRREVRARGSKCSLRIWAQDPVCIPSHSKSLSFSASSHSLSLKSRGGHLLANARSQQKDKDCLANG